MEPRITPGVKGWVVAMPCGLRSLGCQTLGSFQEGEAPQRGTGPCVVPDTQPSPRSALPPPQHTQASCLLMDGSMALWEGLRIASRSEENLKRLQDDPSYPGLLRQPAGGT